MMSVTALPATGAGEESGMMVPLVLLSLVVAAGAAGAGLRRAA